VTAAFSEGLAGVTVDDGSEEAHCGYIDHAGNLVVQPRLQMAFSFSQGLAPVMDEGRFGYIDNKGNMVVPARFDWALPFCEGRAAVMVGELWGFIDKTGFMVIAPRFVWATPFENGLATVRTDDAAPRNGYIDRSGKLVWEEHGSLWGSGVMSRSSRSNITSQYEAVFLTSLPTR
jgi:hypothetical protein